MSNEQIKKIEKILDAMLLDYEDGRYSFKGSPFSPIYEINERFKLFSIYEFQHEHSYHIKYMSYLTTEEVNKLQQCSEVLNW